MTKSRKRILLSSIAMLLVALVALGSATFAWFTVQKTVTADTMKVVATAKKGIEITIDNGETIDSSTKSYAAAEKALMDVSWESVYASEGQIPSSSVTDKTNGTYSGTYMDAGAVPTPVQTKGQEGVSAAADSTYFRVYRVGVRSAKNDDDSYTAHDISAAITIAGKTNADGSNFVRAALCSDDFSTVYATYASTALTAANNKPITGAHAVSTNGVACLASDATVTVADTDTTATPVYYNVVVWFEGTDPDCKDANVDKGAELAISFTATDM